MKTNSKKTSMPLYIQLKEDIKKSIQSGEYRVGSQIPTEVELCNMYGISRITTRRAIKELEEEGILQKQHGIGTFVMANSMLKRELVSVDGFSEFLVQSGKVPKTKILNTAIINMNELRMESLDIVLEEPILHIKRLHLIDQEPIHLENSYFSLKQLPDLDKHLEESSSIYSIIKNRYKIEMVKNKKILNVIKPNSEQAELLHCAQDTPIYKIEKVAYSDKRLPIQLAQSYLPTNKVTFTITTG
jgi:GntR family transcriptional regulator, frlABCD operon transcriptional regulator